MVSWLPHAVVPGLFALAFLRRLPRGWVMAFVPLVWVQDLDYFAPGHHREWTHNVFVPLAFLFLAVWAWRRKAPAEPFWDVATRPGWALAGLLCAYYTASHVFLDVFAGGAVLLWPLADINFFLLYEVHLDLSTGAITPVEEAGTAVGPPQPSSDYTWLSYEHSAILAFLLASALVAGALWLRRRRRLAPPIHKGQDPPAGR